MVNFMGYSSTMVGIIGTIALPYIVQVGFSESCGNEILGITAPLLAALPGAALAWWGRMRAKGPTTLGGFRK